MKEELKWEGPKKGGEVIQKSEVINGLSIELPKEWGMSPKAQQALEVAVSYSNNKHGLYASIPMVCRGAKCPYAEVCPLVAMDLAPEKDRCPLEVAKILKKFEGYSAELEIDEDNIVDMTLTKELIDIEIQLERAEKKLAIDGDFIQEQVVGISEKTGEAITNPALHKATEYKDKLWKKRHDILQLLNSTRKDKAGDKLTITLDPSTYASRLMAQANELKGGNKVIDMGDIEDDE